MSKQPLIKCDHCGSSGRGKYWRKAHFCPNRDREIEEAREAEAARLPDMAFINRVLSGIESTSEETDAPA